MTTVERLPFPFRGVIDGISWVVAVRSLRVDDLFRRASGRFSGVLPVIPALLLAWTRPGISGEYDCADHKGN